MHLPHRLLRRTGAVALVAALTAVSAAPAYAAAPANDTFAGAVPVAALPFSTTLDTTEATTDPLDLEANPANCGAPATDASVWYDLTLDKDDVVVVDVSSSTYPAGVLVVSGAPGSFEFVTCGPGAVVFDAFAGTTYHLLVIDDQSDGGGNGGTLKLDILQAPPPPDLSVEVSPTGSFDPASGAAIIRGTASCSSDSQIAILAADVTQKVGRGTVWGYSEVELTCDGTAHPWTVTAYPLFPGTKFAGGKTATLTLAFACGLVFCSESYQEHTISLKRNG